MENSVSGVGVLDKAVALLDVLEDGPSGLAQLVESSALSRATTHRLAQALVRHGLLEKDGGGRFCLGRRLAELGAVAGAGPVIAETSLPALESLRDATGESTQLYVLVGRERLCVVSLESPHSLRTIVPVGAVLPLDRGSAGAVLMDREDVRRRGWAQSVEEREKGVASVSAAVRRGGQVVAAVSVSGPLERTTRSPGRRYFAAVTRAARQVEKACGWGDEVQRGHAGDYAPTAS